MRRIRSKLTYANVISSLCLFLVLGGGSAIALTGSNTVFSDDIVDHQVKSPDLAQLSYTPVKPNPHLSSDPCSSGQVGIFCGFVGSAGYRGWQNLGQGFARVAYARDGLGIVHLQGAMMNPGPPAQASIILPPGYRPSATHEFAVAFGMNPSNGSLDYSLSTVRVLTNGTVQLIDVQSGAGDNFNQGVSLDGVEFKAQ
jgi:hypothetical protein